MTHALEVEHLSLAYRLYHDRGRKLKGALHQWLRGRRHYQTFWALDDVSFSVNHGEIVGIIGVNGSGKSTLCQVLAGMLVPDRGTVRIQGEVTPLLRLGPGIEKDLSGRENIILTGMLMGFTKETMLERLDEIVAFSGLGDFADVPVRQYSSGMSARLSFSVVTMLEPDILILDEALSVGDATFRKKSSKVMRDMMGRARLILVVTHDPDFVRESCTLAMWLHKGKIEEYGSPAEVAAHYQAWSQSVSQ